MIRLARELVRLLKDMGIELEEIYIYVDDVRFILRALKQCSTFCKRCMIIWSSEEQAETDRTSCETPTARTARVLGEVLNMICKDLKFTTETLEEFEDRKLPILD